MTLTCNDCGGPLRLKDDNGAEYPETRVEFYECPNCGNEQTKVLTA
jgi:Zn finger protein HypA/HybF involved in hydrogenase expression